MHWAIRRRRRSADGGETGRLIHRQSGRRIVPGHAPAQYGNERSIDVLPKPDQLICYRHAEAIAETRIVPELAPVHAGERKEGQDGEAHIVSV